MVYNSRIGKSKYCISKGEYNKFKPFKNLPFALVGSYFGGIYGHSIIFQYKLQILGDFPYLCRPKFAKLC